MLNMDHNILWDIKYILIITELTIVQAYFINDINLDLFLQYTMLHMISNSRAVRIILRETPYMKQHV
jgi:hypothetical protein